MPMLQTIVTCKGVPTLRTSHQGWNTSITIMCFAGMLTLFIAGVAISLTAHIAPATVAAVAPPQRVTVPLSIFINLPGRQKDWPQYSNTDIKVPANSLVTIVVHDHDLGDTLLPKTSPYTRVTGTENGQATLNGHPYTSLGYDKIAHTFTVPQLGINVPFPGDIKETDAVSFTFKTGNPGTYAFQCVVPCGSGPSGYMGAMMTKGYMLGTITIF